MSKTINILIDSIKDIIAPKICVVCDTMINDGAYTFLCSKCLNSAEPAPNSIELLARLSEKFDANEIAISNIISLFSSLEIDETNIMKAIYHLKYKSLPKIGIELGIELGEVIKFESNILYDAIVPLPLHSARKRERGYNQSEYIAIGVSKVLNVKVDNQILKRSNYTISQTKLDSQERKSNVKNVFQTINKNLKNSKLLLIDDVLTTGSTLNYAALALINGGASEIHAATIISAK